MDTGIQFAHFFQTYIFLSFLILITKIEDSWYLEKAKISDEQATINIVIGYLIINLNPFLKKKFTFY